MIRKSTSSEEKERRRRNDARRRMRSIWFVGAGLEGKRRREMDKKGTIKGGRRG